MCVCRLAPQRTWSPRDRWSTITRRWTASRRRQSVPSSASSNASSAMCTPPTHHARGPAPPAAALCSADQPGIAALQHAFCSTAACVEQHCSVRSAAPQHTLSSTAACVQQQRRAHCLPGRLAAVPSQAPLLRRRADGLIPAIPARPATGHHVRGPRAAAAGCRGRRPGIRHGQHPVGADVRTAQRVRVRAAWPPSPRGQPSIASRPSPASPS